MLDAFEQDEYAEKHKSGPGFRFGLVWVVANVACLEIGRSIPTWVGNLPISWMPVITAVQNLDWLWIGLFSGLAQSLVLSRYFKWRGALEWMGATILGYVARGFVVSLLYEVLFNLLPSELIGDYYIFLSALYFSIMLVVGAAGGAALGIVQRRTLEHRVANPNRWLWANAGTAALTFLAVASIDLRTTYMSYLPVQVVPGFDCYCVIYNRYQPLTIGSTFNLINDLVVSVTLGIVLVHLLRHPASQAEWSVKWRERRQRLPKAMTEAQPSPEVLLEQQRQR